MYGIGLTCGVYTALIQEVFKNSGISEKSRDSKHNLLYTFLYLH